MLTFKCNVLPGHYEVCLGRGVAIRHMDATELVLRGVVGKPKHPCPYWQQAFEVEDVVGIYVADELEWRLRHAFCHN